MQMACGPMQMMCGWHADDMQMTCRQHESEISGKISLADDICHPHVIHKSSGSMHIVCRGWQQLCIKPTGFLVINYNLSLVRAKLSFIGLTGQVGVSCLYTTHNYAERPLSQSIWLIFTTFKRSSWNVIFSIVCVYIPGPCPFWSMSFLVPGPFKGGRYVKESGYVLGWVYLGRGGYV